jgi:hypothetical protein
LLRIVPRLEKLEADAVRRVVLERDARGKVRRGVESTSALALLDGLWGTEFVDPIGASGWAIKALLDAITCAVDAIGGSQVNLGDYAGHIDATEIYKKNVNMECGPKKEGIQLTSHTASMLKLREQVLQLIAADLTIPALVIVTKDVNFAIMAIVTCDKRTSESGRNESENRSDSCGRDMHLAKVSRVVCR